MPALQDRVNGKSALVSCVPVLEIERARNNCGGVAMATSLAVCLCDVVIPSQQVVFHSKFFYDSRKRLHVAWPGLVPFHFTPLFGTGCVWGE